MRRAVTIDSLNRMAQTDFESALPGHELVAAGLDDLAPRLQRLGVEIPQRVLPQPFERQLYARLSDRLGNGAHSHYNSLIRRIVSYVRALERERSRQEVDADSGKP